MQTSAENVFACGNVVHVNDLADNVSTESMKAGRFAAKYAKGILPEVKKTVRNVTGENVRYLCPQSLAIPEESEKVTLYFRVLHPDQNVRIVAKSGDKILSSKRAQRVNPGEMEHIDFQTGELVEDTVTVELVKED